MLRVGRGRELISSASGGDGEATRRRFTPQYKLAIQNAELCETPGEIGKLLRRDCGARIPGWRSGAGRVARRWRRSAARGPRAGSVRKVRKLERENARLREELRKAAHRDRGHLEDGHSGQRQVPGDAGAVAAGGFDPHAQQLAVRPEPGKHRPVSGSCRGERFGAEHRASERRRRCANPGGCRRSRPQLCLAIPPLSGMSTERRAR